MVKMLLILWMVVCLFWMSRLLGVGTLIGFGVLIVLILILTLVGKRVSAARCARLQRDVERILARGRTLEETGLHADACWLYAQMVRKQCDRRDDSSHCREYRERIGRLRQEHGPFDWSHKLANLQDGSRSRLHAFLEYDETIAVIEAREAPPPHHCTQFLDDWYTAERYESEGHFAEAAYHYAQHIWCGDGMEEEAEGSIRRLWKAHGPFDYAKVPDEKSEDTRDAVARLIHFVIDGTLMPSRREARASGARRELERGKELEHAGHYADACYLYAEMLRTQPDVLEYVGATDECRSRMDRLFRLHGPFDWSHKLAEICSGDRAIRLAKYLDHERVVATIEGRDVPTSLATYVQHTDLDSYGDAQEAEAAGRYAEAVYHYARAVWGSDGLDTGAARIRALASQHGPFDYSGTLPYRDLDDGYHRVTLRLIRFVVSQT